MQRQLSLYFIESKKGMSAKQEVASVKQAVRSYGLHLTRKYLWC